MNNLHRELAPISDSAWAQIEQETSRTLKRYLAGRRVVDLKGPAGTALSAIGTGHLRAITAPEKGIVAKILEQREAWFYAIGNAHAGNREVVVDFRPGE